MKAIRVCAVLTGACLTLACTGLPTGALASGAPAHISPSQASLHESLAASLPADGTTFSLASGPHFQSVGFPTAGPGTASVTLSIHLPASLLSSEFELVVQNRKTGAFLANPLTGTASKSDPSLVRDTLSLAAGSYVIALYESPQAASTPPWGCRASVAVHGATFVPLTPAPVTQGGSATFTGTVTRGSGATAPVILAVPVAATSALATSVSATSAGQFHLRVPGTGLYDLIAFVPGRGSVALYAVCTLAHAQAAISVTMPDWSDRLFTVVAQQGLAYTGHPLSVWGHSNSSASPTFSIAALPHAPAIRTVRLSVHQHAFSYTSIPWTKNYANLSASYSVSQSGKTMLFTTLPGVPSGTNDNFAWPLNRWPWYLAWSVSSLPAATSGTPSSQRLFAAPVEAALHSLSLHTRLPLGGPTLLPPSQWVKGYPSPTTQVMKNGWSVQVYQTTRPYPPNNPQIYAKNKQGYPVHLSDWELGPSWSFGMSRVRTAQTLPPLHSEAMDALLSDSLTVSAYEPWRHWPRHAVSLGHGIMGYVYQWKTYTLTYVWQEGDWTFVLPDSLSGDALQTTRAMVSYMNVRLLPPAPGWMSILSGVHGYYASASWLADGYRHVAGRAGENPIHEAVGVLRMAVHWRMWP